MGDTKPTKPNGKGPPSSKKRVAEEDHPEGKEPELTDTVFIRNLARFDTTQESLKEYIEKNFGETVYCLICKDKETGESKGTGFVKFKSVEGAEKCLEEFEDPEHQTKFFLDGRNLFVLPALSRDKISEVKRAVAPSNESEGGEKKKKKPRHNRVRAPNSQTASSPGQPDPHKPKLAQPNKFRDNHGKDKNNKKKKDTSFRDNKGNPQSRNVKRTAPSTDSKNKSKANRKSTPNKPSKHISSHKPSPGGKEMKGVKKSKKKDQKSKMKVLSKQGTRNKRGRH